MGIIASMLLEYTVETGSILLQNESKKGFPLWKKLKFYTTTKFLLKGQKVRISFAYLFRIRIYDSYLLVPSSRLHYYQPPGGVYKFHPDRNFRRFQDWGVDIDNSLAIDDDSENDLRLKIPSENLIAFFDWFLSGQDRENTPIREFKEEILDENILSNIFLHPNFNFLWQVRYPIRWSEHFQCYEFIVHDIFELISTPEQEKELKQLSQIELSDKFKLADEDCINRLGYDIKSKKTPFHISPHTKSILSSSFKPK